MSSERGKSEKDSGKPGEESAAPASSRSGWRKDRQYAVWAGVCSGLGLSTPVPAWAWRILFLLLFLFYGAGLLVYLALWALMPADPVTPKPAPVTPLFRRIDWWTFGATTLLVLVGYMLTLAPDLTLEDSGELAVGSYYAGVPHPPGYPVWTLYTWLFTELLPFMNIAWRVAVSSAVAAALVCGAIALMVSRGSSMMMEGITFLKGIESRWENALCMVSGFVAGTLMGFNGFMWSQAVIVEVYTLSVLSLVAVLCFLLRWVYAPHQWRYLYVAFFLFGICFTNHQTLILAVIGIEVMVLLAHPKLGRDLFILNSIVFLLALVLKGMGKIGMFENNLPLFVIFNLIGIASLLVSGMMIVKTRSWLTEWRHVLVIVAVCALGGSFYFYMPLASMTNPPMNWGYPRTWEGFIHALTRGQYEKANPTTDVFRFVQQVIMYIQGAIKEFNFVYLVVGLAPFLYYRWMSKRERSWVMGLFAIYLCLALLLLIILNPGLDKQSRELNRVFFTASHVVIAMGIGYGLALIGASLALFYHQYRSWALAASVAAALIALYALADVMVRVQYPITLYTAGYGLLLALAAGVAFFAARHQPPMNVLLVLFALMPIHPIMAHWSDNEQYGHLFGYWFGHDMFAPPFQSEEGEPLYPDMADNAILFGGTDPGRFCPTYMIFCESFIPPEDKRDPDFNRRDVYIITQNALADHTYLSYIRAHYNRSTQNDPPFFQEMLRTPSDRQRGTTNFVARMAAPLDEFFLSLGSYIEKQRRAGTSYFDESDFVDLPALVRQLQPNNSSPPLSDYLWDQLGSDTKEAIEEAVSAGDDGFTEHGEAVAKGLAADLNRLLEDGLIYTEERFEGVQLSDYTSRFLEQNPPTSARIRLNRLLLEAAYPKAIAESPAGVYPGLEIHTPTPAESQRAFQQYIQDARRRLIHDQQHPNEPPQVKPGEGVSFTPDGKVQVSGQVSVMGINGILTEIIFNQNPDHEFYVEESFPLDWMYPHLTPYGIIMKLNREPVQEITEEMVRKDHQFWTRYSQRLCGNWITYDTPVKEICDFVRRVYRRRNFDDFTGSRMFVRDEDSQKAFSKLRSAIAGLYSWRINHAQSPAEQQRMIKEADFAFRQAFAFCPFSPEAVFRYSNLLISLNRVEDALMIARTCLLFDPENQNVVNLIQQLEAFRKGQQGVPLTQQEQQGLADQLGQLEKQYEANPSNLQAAMDLAAAYVQLQKGGPAKQLLDRVLTHPDANASTYLSAAQGYAQLGNLPKLEMALQKLVEVQPENPEAWFDLSAVQVALGQQGRRAGDPEGMARKFSAAIESLNRALQLSDQRLQNQPNANNLRETVQEDPRFDPIRQMSEYQRIMGNN